MASISSFAIEINCQNDDDKTIATKILNSGKSFENDTVTSDMVKKQEINQYIRGKGFKSDLFYCIDAGTPSVNWGSTYDTELEKDGNVSHRCVSELDVANLRAVNCL